MYNQTIPVYSGQSVIERMRYLLVIFAIGYVPLTSFGQEVDQVVHLDDFTVFGSRLKDGEIGLRSVSTDTLLMFHHSGNSFSELIRNIGAGQIRSFGPSGLSTPSFRGTGAAQTAVLWNGLSLNSPLNGSQDVSQLPVSIFDAMSIQKGGASSLYGSGAIGGTIQLENPFFFNQGPSFILRNEFGSFGHQFYDLAFKTSNKTKAFSIGLFHRTVENDFPYRNIYQRPLTEEVRRNAAYQQSGIVQQTDFRLNDHQILGYKIWLQTNHYEVPNSILEGNEAEAEQSDHTIRILGHWNFAKGATGLTFKQAFFYHKLHFTDVSINSVSNYYTWISRFENAWDISSAWQMVSGVNHRYEYAGTENFGSVPRRANTAFFNSLKFKSPTGLLAVAFNLRQELTDGELVPFSPSLGVRYAPVDVFVFRGSLSRNYRLPTFNDQYWNGEGGFGNPDLLAESSVGGELGFDWSVIRKKAFEVNISQTVFGQSVDNWILWRPESGDDWTPDNIKKVWARGMETSLTGTISKPDWTVGFGFNYHYTRATNEEVETPFEREKGSQLGYTPIHETVFNSTFSYKKTSLTIRHNYVGKQYTDGENIEVFALPDYHVVGAVISHYFTWKRMTTRAHFEIDNLLDETYENRRGHPMYGRNFSIGLQMNFIKNRKEQSFEN